MPSSHSSVIGDGGARGALASRTLAQRVAVTGAAAGLCSSRCYYAMPNAAYMNSTRMNGPGGGSVSLRVGSGSIERSSRVLGGLDSRVEPVG